MIRFTGLKLFLRRNERKEKVISKIIFGAQVLLVFVLGAVGFCGPVTYAADEEHQGFPLSLNSIVLFALYENPDIEILRSREQQAHYAIKEKQASFLPDIQIQAKGGRAYNSPGAGVAPGTISVNNSTQVTLNMEQILFDGFKTVNEVRNRESLEKSSQFRTQAVIEDVINQAVDNYLKALRYQEEIKTGQNLLADINGTVKTIEQLFEAGATGKVMLDYAKSRQAFATTELNRAYSSLNDAISNLEFLAGKLPPDFIAIPPEELSPDKIDLQYYLEATEEKNSQVLASAQEVDAMEDLLAAEKGKYFPSVTFNVKADETHNDGGPVGRAREMSATFRANYQIFDGFKRRASTGRIKSQIMELSQKRLQVLKQLRRDVKLAYNQVQTNQQALELTEIEIASNIAQEQLNEENFKSGNINVIELIESAERLKDSYVKKHKLTYDMYLSSYKLLVITGVLKKEYFCETCIADMAKN